MKRQIKFKGKSLINGKWVTGDSIKHTDNVSEKGIEELTYIGNNVPNASKVGAMKWIPVNPSTVGQFTGLTDKNGKEIYEGDIVRFHFMTLGDYASKLIPTEKFIGEITTNKYNQWVILSDGMEIHIENAILYGEIIGTIHDKIKEE